MRVLNLLSSGGIGGIEVLCEDIGRNSPYENGFCFLYDKGVIYEEMKNADLQVYDVSDDNFLNKIRHVNKIAKNYDIIVAHHGSLGMHAFFWLLSLVNRNSKYVLMAHSCFETEQYYFRNPFKTLIRKYILKAVMRRADKIIYVSEAGRKSFTDSFKIDRNKTAVVYNGVSNRVIIGGKDNKPKFNNILKILYIGRLVKVKGIDLMIKAIKKVDIPIDFVILGDGPERDSLVKLTKDMKLEDRVHFMGQRRDKDMFYKEANVFVYPSIWEEVFGISIVEAMAYGIPCVANKVGGIPEIIENGKNGFLTESKDENGIAKVLESIYKMYTLNTMEGVEKSAKVTANKFSICNTVLNLKHEYENML